jgi:DNA (cytosine-5)-methyltransferase 1
MLIKSSPTYYMDIQATTCQDQLPQKNSSHTPPISLELFAGAGGLALGVHAAGFKLLGLVERDSFATETLRENSQRVLELEPGLVLEAEAEAVDYDQFAGRVDLLSGGPPCQPFSTGGRNRGASDKRNMFPVFLNAMATIRPKAILIENVKGLLRESFQDYYNYLLKRLQYPLHQRAVAESWYDHYQRLLKVENGCFTDDEQYTVTYQLVDSADFGIPQR